MSRTLQTPHLSRYTPEDPKERDRSGRESRRLFYRAPELMFRPDNYGCEVDMWAVGCILAEMASSDPLFRESSELELLLKIFRLRGSPGADLITKYAKSSSENGDPMVAFPAWTRFSLTELSSANPAVCRKL